MSVTATKPATAIEWVKLAKQAIGEVDERFLALDDWRTGTHRSDDLRWDNGYGCGTIACAAGHLAAHPVFREAGLYANRHGAPKIDTVDSHGDPDSYVGAQAMSEVMGISNLDAMILFGSRDASGMLGRSEEEADNGYSDKEVFGLRCDALIKRLERAHAVPHTTDSKGTTES